METIDQILSSHPHRLPPYRQQHEALRRSIKRRVFALFMDQGTGKTKVIIDTAAILFDRNIIEALCVVAPMDVHVQWVEEQLPLHLPSHIRARCAVWRAASVRASRASSTVASPVVRAVDGAFERGDPVIVLGPDGTPVARGLSAYASVDAIRIVGHRSDEIEAILGWRGRDEIIHRDDLVLL